MSAYFKDKVVVVTGGTDGVVETIQELHNRNYTLCVASNGRSPYILSILQTYGLESFFQKLVVINNKGIESKGDILKSYINQFHCSGENILMVGDRKSDLDAALDAESPFAFCEYGHAELGEIDTYAMKLKIIKDLLDYLA